MRIALFHDVPSGGAKRSIYEWTRRLSKTHTIDVYTLSSADHVFCDIRPFVHEHRVFNFSQRMLFGSPWGRLNQLQRWRDLNELERIGLQIALQIDAGCYDVVFANSCIHSGVPLFLQFLRTPSVFYLHEPFGRRFVRQCNRPYTASNVWRDVMNKFDPLIKLYRHSLEASQLRSLQRSTKVLANSEFTQIQMKKAFGLNAAVCRLGVDFETFRPRQINENNNHVISVGELSPRKGFDFLVESLREIPIQDRPQLRIACNSVDESEEDYVQSLARKYCVDLKVLTKLNTEELSIEYNKARLCIYAPVLEPFGLVPLEAMSCGKPVVGVREGGVEETIVHRQTGLLIERNPKKFAEAIQHLLSNPSLAAEYGRQGREHVLRSWTWDKSVATLEDQFLNFASTSIGDSPTMTNTTDAFSSLPYRLVN